MIQDLKQELNSIYRDMQKSVLKQDLKIDSVLSNISSMDIQEKTKLLEVVSGNVLKIISNKNLL